MLNATGIHTVLIGDYAGGLDTGSYTLRICFGPCTAVPVFDPLNPVAGSGFPSSNTGRSVNVGSGDKSYWHTDLLIPGKGVSLEFTRYYHSGSTYAGSLGSGWTHNYDLYLSFHEDGDVTVRYAQGHSVRFDLSGSTYTPRAGIFDTLVKNGDNTYTLTQIDQTKYNFSTVGKLTSIVDRNAWATTISYNGNGHISSVTDPGGRALTFTTDGSTGRITQIADPMSPARTVGFTYTNGDLTQVTDVKGGATSYAYNLGRMTSLTDPNSHVVFSHIYDNASRVVEQTNAVGGKTCIYYGTGPTYTSAGCPGVSPGPSSSQTITVDPRGKKTTYGGDASNRTVTVTDHDGNATTFTYDSSHNRTCISDPLSHRTGFTYDSKGNVTGVIDAENTNVSCGLKTGGVKWTYAYTSNNDIDLQTDPLGRQTDYVYDANGNLTELMHKDAGGATKLRTCQTRPTSGVNKGLVTEVIQSTTLTDCTGNKTKITYDSYGNVTEVIDPRFSSQGTPPKTTATYDLGGRRLTVTNELSHTTTFTYDNQNNVLTGADHLGNTTANTYDAKGNLKTLRDANRHTVGTAESGSNCGTAGTGDAVDNDGDGAIDDGCPSTIYNYDDADRLISVVDAGGKTTAYAYDGNGNLTSVTNANRQPVGTAETNCGASGTGDGLDNDSDGAVDDGCPSVIYAYDNLGRLSSEKDALGNTWSYGYDAATRMTSRTDAKSQITAVGYNLRNDVTSIDHPAGTADVTYQYDAVRNLTQMVDGSGTTTYTPDALNRPSSITFPGSRTVSYGYNNVGNTTSITYPGGSNQVSYAYDEANNLTSVTDWNSSQTTYAYNNAGMLTTITLPTGTGITGTYGYDNADRLTSVTWNKGGTIPSAAYTLDKAGKPSQRVDGLGIHTYVYDVLNRLTSVTYPGPTTDTYTYDAVGNRLTKNATNYTYDAADRLTATGGTNYTYDNNGNLMARGADSFGWDAADRLTSATVGGTSTTFGQDGSYLRQSVTTGGNTKTFTWDLGRQIPQVLDDGSFSYIYGLGRVAEIGPGTTTHYYLADALGSVMALVNSSGTIVNTYEYDVFGAIRSSTGAQANSFTFTGEQGDATTSLEYLRMRYYDPATGRFISRDPYAGSAESPLSQNPFAYAEDNPTAKTDPSGLSVDLACQMRDYTANLGNPFPAGSNAHTTFEVAKAKLVAGLSKICENSKAVAIVKECLIWGAVGAAVGGGPQGAAFGCAAGAVSKAIDTYMDGPFKPFAQCAAWGLGGVASVPRAVGKMSRGGVGATSCAAGVASHFNKFLSPATDCSIWGYAGTTVGVILRSPRVETGAKGVVGCIGGAASWATN